MPTTMPLLRSTTGVNNKIDPVRLAYDSEKGIVELAAAVNVWIDDTGRIARRGGTSMLYSLANAHSPFTYGGFLYVASGSFIYKFDSAFVPMIYSAGLTPGLPVAYAGLFDKVYFSNGVETGILGPFGVDPWGGYTHVGPRNTAPLADPPAGSILEAWNGRILIAVGPTLFFTEPYNPLAVSLENGFLPFPDEIVLLAAVFDGVWIGTRSAIYFISGETMETVTFRQVAPYGAVPGAYTKIAGELIGADTDLTGKTVIIMDTQAGRCIASEQGYFRNLTKDKLNMPTVSSGTMGVEPTLGVCVSLLNE